MSNSPSAPPSPRPILRPRPNSPKPKDVRSSSVEDRRTLGRASMTFRAGGPVVSRSANNSDDEREEEERGGNGEGDDQESFSEWLARYRIGQAGASDEIPRPPASILAILEGRAELPEAEQDSPTSGSGEYSSPPNSASLSHISDSSSPAPSITSLPSLHSLTAATLLDFYRRKGHFPAPPGPYEEERLRLAHKYGLDAPVRRKAIDRICNLAKRYFRTSSVVISLTFDDHQVLGAERGWGGEEPGLDVPPRPLGMGPAFCTHAMLASYRDPQAVFIVPDADEDWRFKKNPYTRGNGGGLSFYAAANVNLPVPERERTQDMPETLASGALCLIDSKPRPAADFTEEDREVLTDMAAMISREFRLGFEQRRREQEGAQSDFVGVFLHHALVMPPQPGDLRQAVSDTGSPPVTPPAMATTIPQLNTTPGAKKSNGRPNTAKSTKSTTSTADGTNEEDKETLFALASRQLRTLTHAGACAIVDLRSFRPATSFGNPNHHFHHAPSPSTASNPSSSFATPSLAAAGLNGANPFGTTSPSSFQDGSSTTSHFKRPVTPSSGTTSSHPPIRRESLNSQFWRSSGPQVRGRGRLSLMGSEGDIPWVDVFKRRRRRRKTAAAAAAAAAAEAEREGETREERSGGGGESAGESTAGEGETDAEDSEREREGRKIEAAVQETLRAYYENVPSAPEECLLNANAFVSNGVIPASKASASIAVPIFDVDGAPACLIILTSGEKWFDFEPNDRRFASSVGAVIVGSLLRQRASEADRAKLAFVSQVSHELRTPCHGVNSQLELIREFSSPSELARITPLLDTAEACLESLQDVLNDTLDFSKLTNASPAEAADLARRAQVPADLEALAENVISSTWVRKQRSDLVNQDVRKEHVQAGEGGGAKVKLVLEVEERKGGWGVLVDVGGLKRVLLNLLGNASKFTQTGEIKLSLKEVGIIPRGGTARDGRVRRLISLTVMDTGIGMDATFLRDGLLVPFVQADPFAQGAGLGLSIVNSIVGRLCGRLDVTSQKGLGTTMTVTLPLDFTSASETQTTSPLNAQAAPLPRIKRRVISEELDAVLRSGANNSSAATATATASPATTDDVALPLSSPSLTNPNTNGLDFSTAVSAARAALFPPPSAPTLEPPTLLKRNSSRSIRRAASARPAASTQIGQEDLVVEVAKLALANSPEVVRNAVGNEAEVGGVVKEKEKEKERRKVKVLCAEDNPIGRNILVKLFTGKGIEFAAAEDGQEAVELYEAGEGSYTICFVDVQMPRKDGIQASTDIRALEQLHHWEPARIIALTGLSNEVEMQKALGADGPIDSWLVKGGKSLRVILDEISAQQKELDENGCVLSPRLG